MRKFLAIYLVVLLFVFSTSVPGFAQTTNPPATEAKPPAKPADLTTTIPADVIQVIEARQKALDAQNVEFSVYSYFKPVRIQSGEVGNAKNKDIVGDVTRYSRDMKATQPYIDIKTSTYFLETWYDFTTLPSVSIGPGIQALSISWETSKILLLSSFSPLTFTFPFPGIEHPRTTQIYWYVNDGKWQKQITMYAFSWSFGITVGKVSEAGDLSAGFQLIPCQMTINSISFGIGANWTSTGNLDMCSLKNWSTIIPISYTFGL